MQFLMRDKEKLPLAGSSHCVFKGDRLSENYLPDSIFAPSVERCGPEMMVVCPGAWQHYSQARSHPRKARMHHLKI